MEHYRLGVEAAPVEEAQHGRHRLVAAVAVEADLPVLQARLADERLGPQDLDDGRGAAVHADREDVAGDLSLEGVGRALGDDPPVVDDGERVAERVRLFQVAGRQEDRRAAVAEAPDLFPEPGPGLRVEPGRGLVEEEERGRCTRPMPMFSRIALGQPRGIVPIRVAGGPTHLSLHRPAGVPVRLSVHDASRVSLDGTLAGRGNVTCETPGAGSAEARFEIESVGGASRVVFDVR